MKYFVLALAVFSSVFCFGQNVINTIRIDSFEENFRKGNKIEVVSSESGEPISLKDGTYVFEFENQSGKLNLKNGIINGTFSFKAVKGEKYQLDYIVENSVATQLQVLEEGVLSQEAKLTGDQITGKSYFENGALRSEYVFNVKTEQEQKISYFPDGKIQHKTFNIKNETYALEYYDSGGKLTSRIYKKKNVVYTDNYNGGKLAKRYYVNAKNQEVREFYYGVIYLGKDVIDGSKIYHYDKNGNPSKFSLEPVEEKDAEKVEETSAVAPITKFVDEQTKKQKTELVPAEFPGGLDAFKKYLQDDLDLEKVDGKCHVDFEMVVLTDGSLELVDAPVSPNIDCKREVIRMLKKSPKWKPAIKHETPVESLVTIQMVLVGYIEE